MNCKAPFREGPFYSLYLWFRYSVKYSCWRFAQGGAYDIKETVSLLMNGTAFLCTRLIVFITSVYFTSSKTTFIDYQCVSTGCCIHVAKIKISIDNQHVTKPIQRYRFSSKQPKENTEKITNLPHFFRFASSLSCINGNENVKRHRSCHTVLLMIVPNVSL